MVILYYLLLNDTYLLGGRNFAQDFCENEARGEGGVDEERLGKSCTSSWERGGGGIRDTQSRRGCAGNIPYYAFY